MTVRFHREKQRTVNDIFNSAIQPRAAVALQDIAQKVVQYAKTTHRYQNRTGALQESISWVPPVKVGDSFQTVIYAGGWSIAKYAMDYGRRKTTGVQRRNRRYQRGESFRPKRGQGLYVIYARFLENKGWPVLSHSIARHKPLISRVLQQELKLKGVA
jgi:hypothetical protein